MEKRKILACELENIGVLFLGRTGEHEATTFVFDASDWLRGYADGVIGLTVKRPDGLTYPAQAGEAGADGTLTWEPTIDDLAIEGAGELELTITAGGKVKKSARCPTRIDASMEQNGDAPTGTEPGWVTQLFEALPNIENASESIAAANAAAEAANAAAARSPYIDEKTKNWMIWDAGKGAYVDTGISSVGKDFRILGIYETYDVLVSSVIAPAQGDHYNVGPDEDGLYTLYMYDSEKGWVNKGVMTGVPGGGTTGQILIKQSDANGDAIWKTPTAQDVGALPSDGTAANASRLDGKDSVYFLRPYNLLDNSDFTNPVNQRGFISGSALGNEAYFIDRWRNTWKEDPDWVQYPVFDENGLSGMTANEGFVQVVDLSQYVGKAVTIAIYSDYDNPTHCASGTVVKTDAWSEIAASQNWECNVTYNGYQWVVNVRVPCKYIALYTGAYTLETLPPYVPKGYAVELAECQRYLPVAIITGEDEFKSIGAGVATSESEIKIVIPVPTSPRKTPIIFCEGISNLLLRGGSSLVPTAVSVDISSMNAVTITCTVSGAVVGAAYELFAMPGVKLLLSSEL